MHGKGVSGYEIRTYNRTDSEGSDQGKEQVHRQLLKEADSVLRDCDINGSPVLFLHQGYARQGNVGADNGGADVPCHHIVNLREGGPACGKVFHKIFQMEVPPSREPGLQGRKQVCKTGKKETDGNGGGSP